MTKLPHRTGMRHLATASALASVIALSGCAYLAGPHLETPKPPPIPSGGAPVPASAETVLHDGQQVVATSAEGKIKIEAGPGLRRVFDWDGFRRGAIVTPRTTPFANGKGDGLTFDGTPKVWADAGGITRLRYEEGDRYFDNESDALIWMQIRRLYFVYNDNGLALGWAKDGNTLHVELWQFYIDGKKPTSMPDSQDADITLGKLVVEPQKMSPVLVFPNGNTEPYNSQTAAQLKHPSSSSSTSCNFFERLFRQCKPQSSKTPNTPPAASPPPAAKPSQPSMPAPSSTSSTSSSNAGANNSASSTSTASGPKATVAGDTVNVRSKPSTHSEVLMQAHQGQTVVILKKDRGWRYVQFDNGKKGWMANFLLKDAK